jgi:hypothetical protein
LNLKNVFPASLISFGVIAEMHWIEAQLLSDKNTQCRWWLLALLENPSWKSQVTKHQGKAQTIGIAAVSIDQGDVLGAQGVVANHPAFIGCGGIENEPLRLGE